MSGRKEGRLPTREKPVMEKGVLPVMEKGVLPVMEKGVLPVMEKGGAAAQAAGWKKT